MRIINNFNDFFVNDYEYIFEKITDLLAELNDQTIFISGITGFIGKNLLRTIVEFKKNNNLNIKIVSLSRNPDKFFDFHPEFRDLPYLEILEGDIISNKFLHQINQEINYIIHSATGTQEHKNKEEGYYWFSTIVQGTYNMLQLAQKNPIENFLYISSGAVYGFNKHSLDDFKEEINIHSLIDKDEHPYKDGKRIAELILQSSLKDKTKLTIVRGFSFYGEYLNSDSHFAIANFLKLAKEKQDIQINSSGESIRSYLHSSDMIILLYKMLINNFHSEIFNLGGQKHLKIKELAEWIARVKNQEDITQSKKLQIRINNNLDDKAKFYAPCTKKLEKFFQIH